MRIRMLFFPIELLKDESFILVFWFWILDGADIEGKEEIILISEYKNTCESWNSLCLPVQVYKSLGGNQGNYLESPGNCYVKLK